MTEIFLEHPWLLACALVAAVVVACVAIVFVTDYLAKTRQAESDAALKQEMLNRGMTAADIKTVLEARSDPQGSAAAANQPVRVGLGKFQVEVGHPARSS